MSEILEDAFKDDGEVKLYGEDIEQDKMICTDISSNELPESKSNTVSFMKVEDLSSDCKSLLAVSDSCICYSVTQKKNLLRLMDTISGDKEILRGHDGAITDLKFSADGSVLCSTDNSAVAGKPHTIVWKKNENGISFAIATQMMLKGSMLAAHPSQNNVWAISDRSSVGIFSSARVNMNIPAKYAELPMSVTFDAETVSDIAFTPNGKSLVVTLENKNGDKVNHYHIYSIGVGSDGVIKGNESLTRVVNHQPYSFDENFYAEPILAVKCIHQWVVTASRSTSGTAAHETYYIRVCNHEGAKINVLQTITLELPSFNSKINSTSLANPSLECSLHSDMKNDRYLIFSSRKSSFVACLAVSPQGTTTLPLYHITYLNLKAPIVSMDVNTILGREHHSAEEGEHLEMSCYQEEASDQASVQQYHVLFSNLFDYEKYLANTRRIRSRPVSQSNLADLGVIGGPLKRLSSGDDAASINASINAAFLSSPALGSGEANKGKTILSFLNSANSNNGSGSVGSIVAAPKPSEAERASFSSPASTTTTGLTAWLASSASDSVLKPTAVPASSAKKDAAGDLPSFLNFDPPAKNTNILSMIKGNSSSSSSITPVTPVTPVAVKASTTPAISSPAASTTTHATATADKSAKKSASKQEKVAVLSKEPSEDSLVAAAAASAAKNNKKAEKLLNSFADDRSDQGSVSSVQKNMSTPTGGLQSSSIDLNGTPASIVSSLADIKQAVRSTAKNAVTKEGLDSLKEELLKETKAVQQKSVDQIQQSVKKMIEAEVKKSIEAAFSAGKWKQEISTAIIEALQADLAPVVAQKVRDSVKDTVKDSIKSVLTTSFRGAFENTLVPSFQAGTDRMFAQVQTSFETGMAGLAEEGRKYHQGTARSTESLENEIRELKHTVHRLESLVVDLAEKVSTVGLRTDDIHADPEPVEDAFSLLEKGLVSDAVLRALEDKDVSVTVSLLDRLTPAAVNAKCSNLVRLCITQQLAADMSVNIPEEGVAKRVEWIKNLVLSLVSGPSTVGSDATYDRSFKSTIQMVLESIQSAKQLIFGDNGEEASQVPQSVGTDLQLLEFVIQSKL